MFDHMGFFQMYFLIRWTEDNEPIATFNMKIQ